MLGNDDTPTRVNGVNSYCHILSNPFYSGYATRARKDRLTVISVLEGSDTLVYLLDARTSGWLEKFGVPIWAQRVVAGWPQGQWLTADEIRKHLDQDLAQRLNVQQQARVLEAAALSAYYAQTDVAIIPILVSDDAPQFKYLTQCHSLCWIHEGRHYKKLTPLMVHHQHLLETFTGSFGISITNFSAIAVRLLRHSPNDSAPSLCACSAQRPVTPVWIGALPLP